MMGPEYGHFWPNGQKPGEKPEEKQMRYHIRIQRRCEYNGLYERNDWRAYREWLVWPKTFHTAYEAQKFMDACFTFKGLRGRRLSASVCQCNPKPTKKNYGAPA